jgi:hypothetical protein
VASAIAPSMSSAVSARVKGLAQVADLAQFVDLAQVARKSAPP